jgi:hypothetical protein
MTLSDIIDVEEALTKTGPELFKELYRIYPVAEPDDYFKNGQWRNDVMKTDIVLIESHRRESGAPDVPDLDDLKLPKLPEASLTGSAPNALGALSLQQKLMPNILPTTPNGAPAITATSTPVVEIRLIALFVSKWKLDAVKAKTELAKLSQGRRRYVISNFKAASQTGAEATKELEAYIAECEADGSWDKAAGTTLPNGLGVSPAPDGAQPAAGLPKFDLIPKGPKAAGVQPAGALPKFDLIPGLKRPLTPTLGLQQNKRLAS